MVIWRRLGAPFFLDDDNNDDDIDNIDDDDNNDCDDAGKVGLMQSQLVALFSSTHNKKSIIFATICDMCFKSATLSKNNS